MKVSTLHDVWTSPDNTRLTSKQFSFRLPVHIAAKIAALCEMFPHKNRTQIVADLLTSALDELEKSLPEAAGGLVEESWHDKIADAIGEERQQLFYLGGARGRFRNLSNKYYLELEAELGNGQPEPLFPDMVGTKDDFAK